MRRKSPRRHMMLMFGRLLSPGFSLWLPLRLPSPGFSLWLPLRLPSPILRMGSTVVSPPGFSIAVRPDHLLAMVSVGIWGAQLGAPAIWMLPIGFPLIMAMGAAMAYLAHPAGARVAHRLFGADARRLGRAGGAASLGAAFTVVAVFAVAHGYAHGVELPASANALAFSAGFVMATGMLHAAGIVIGLLVKWPAGRSRFGAWAV